MIYNVFGGTLNLYSTNPSTYTTGNILFQCLTLDKTVAIDLTIFTMCLVLVI